MRILIVEDDFVGRKIMHKLLMEYGECDIAVDGAEAVRAFLLLRIGLLFRFQMGWPAVCVCIFGAVSGVIARCGKGVGGIAGLPRGGLQPLSR